MHIFIPIVASGITLYLLRNWWERWQERREWRRVRREIRRIEREAERMRRSKLPKIPMSHWPGTIALGVAMGVALGIIRMKFDF